MAASQRKPINWDKCNDPIAIAGFGDVYFANDGQFWGIKLLVDGKTNHDDWSACPLWIRVLTKTHPKYKFDGDFVKRHQNILGEPYFFDVDAEFTGVIQLGRKDTKSKVYLYIKEREITIIEESEVTALL